jgi:predicted nucleic acid-binding protein
MRSFERLAVPERWILNASPLIVLARIGAEHLFSMLADEVVVPRAVALEVEEGPVEDRARQTLAAGQFTIVDTPPSPAELLAWDLGSGENAVLSLALTDAGWTAILDDAAARSCARSFSVHVRGTLGIVLLARQRGLISSATEVLHSLRLGGFYIDDETVREALTRSVGETWSY